MARIAKKFVKLGTGSDEINSRDIPAHFPSPANYTPTQVGSEGSTQVSSHLKGIDNALGSLGGTPTDIGLTSFSIANNQSSAASITGLSFSTATVRAFTAEISVNIQATGNLYEYFTLEAIYKDSSWDMSIRSVGDNSQVAFTITNAGQVQYTSGNISGFSSGTLRFKAKTVTNP